MYLFYNNIALGAARQGSSEETTWSSLHYAFCIVAPQGNCQHGDREQRGKIKKERQISYSQKGLRVFLQSAFLLQDPTISPLERHDHRDATRTRTHERERERSLLNQKKFTLRLDYWWDSEEERSAGHLKKTEKDTSVVCAERNTHCV